MRRRTSGAQGFFITFEGPDGSGKTTQSQLLLKHLEDEGFEVAWTREPGGTELGELIRDVILHDGRFDDLSPRVEALLLASARAQHVSELIRPELEMGKIVLCDRFTDSTTAYQGGGSGLNIEDMSRLNHFATGSLVPDLVILLDMPIEDGLQRKLGDNIDVSDSLSRIEQRGLAYHRRVRLQFLNLAARAPARWLVLDGRLPAKELNATIQQHVCEQLKKTGQSPSRSKPGRLV